MRTNPVADGQKACSASYRNQIVACLQLGRHQCPHEAANNDQDKVDTDSPRNLKKPVPAIFLLYGRYALSGHGRAPFFGS
jgi:hypothetical protein